MRATAKHVKRVTLYSNTFSYDQAFSITRVMNEQIGMLVRNGYRPNVIVTEGFVAEANFALPEVNLVYIPSIPVSNDGLVPDDWKELTKPLADALDKVFSESDVVITHDIVFRPDLVLYNLLMRRFAEKYPLIVWLNWIHSATSPDLLCPNEEVKAMIKGSFPNSYIVYPNYYEVPRVARNFKYQEDAVKWCPHTTDPADFFGFSKESRDFIEKHDLYSPRVLIVYPVRLDRGKQAHKIVGIGIACKQEGLSTKVVIADFHSTGGDKVTYRDEMREYAKQNGFENDLIFTSDEPAWHLETPRNIVSNLFQLSNIFILPSVSETYSLIAQEAALAGNFLILNQDFPPIRAVYGEGPKYFQFSSAINANSGFDGNTVTQYNEGEYYRDIARYIKYMITFDPVLSKRTWARTERNQQYVFKTFMEPLFYA